MTDAPMVLWDYYMERRYQIHNAVPRPRLQNHWMNPSEAISSKHGDIYNICNLGWYQWVYYRTPKSFSDAKECLGRVPGVIKNEGSEMSQVVLNPKATIVTRR